MPTTTISVSFNMTRHISMPKRCSLFLCTGMRPFFLCSTSSSSSLCLLFPSSILRLQECHFRLKLLPISHAGPIFLSVEPKSVGCGMNSSIYECGSHSEPLKIYSTSRNSSATFSAAPVFQEFRPFLLFERSSSNFNSSSLHTFISFEHPVRNQCISLPGCEYQTYSPDNHTHDLPHCQFTRLTNSF